MKKLLVTAALLATPAYAADLPPITLPVKAPMTVSCTPTQCSGFYVGFNINGIGSNLNVLGNGINGSLFAAGFGIGGQAGYQLWNGTYFFAAEIAGDYMTDPVAAGAANTGYFRTTELVKAGTALAGLFGSNNSGTPAPSQGPTLPVQLLSQVTSPYVILGMGQKSGSNALVSGAGVQAAISAGWNLSLEYQNWQFRDTTVTPAVSQATENVVSMKLNRMF